MATRSGLDAQLGLAEETTYGTYVAATRFLEFDTESLNLTIDQNKARSRRAGQRVLRNDHRKQGKRQAGGAIGMDIGNKGFGLILTKHLLGSVTTTADGTGKKHSGSIGDLFGKSLSFQVGRPDVSGTVQPFSYLGAKIADWEIANTVDDFAKLSITVDANNEVTSQALASATAPTESELLHWSGCVVTVGGAALDVSNVSFRGNNGLKPDRFLMRTGGNLKKEPLEAATREYSGTLEGEFENLTAYNRFVSGTPAIVVATWTAVSTYDTAKPFKLVITANCCVFTGDTPNTDGEAVIMQALPFEIDDDGSNPILLVDYYTSDATP